MQKHAEMLGAPKRETYQICDANEKTAVHIEKKPASEKIRHLLLNDDEDIKWRKRVLHEQINIVPVIQLQLFGFSL